MRRGRQGYSEMRSSTKNNNQSGFRNNMYPPVPKMIIDESKEPITLKKSEITVKKSLQ